MRGLVMEMWEDYGSSCVLCKVKPTSKSISPSGSLGLALLKCKDLSGKTKGIHYRSIRLSRAMDEYRRWLRQKMLSKVTWISSKKVNSKPLDRIWDKWKMNKRPLMHSHSDHWRRGLFKAPPNPNQLSELHAIWTPRSPYWKVQSEEKENEMIPSCFTTCKINIAQLGIQHVQLFVSDIHLKWISDMFIASVMAI